MSDDTAIKVEHISKNFVLPHEKITSVKTAFTNIYRHKDNSSEVQHALKDISFEIKKGEFFGIVGRNGSGKSTMLKILAGIYQPTKGSIQTKGKLVPFIELGVGFNAELSGKENVFLNGAMLGFSRKEVESMYDDIVAFAELEKFMDQKLKNYSSGMQVRLAFSMATRSEADILLVDEVLAVGDADFQRKCFDYFKTLKKNKKTVVFVSHDMDAIREYCDKAVLIEKSELVIEGRSDKVASRYSRMFLQNGQTANQQNTDRWGEGIAVLSSVEAPKQVNPEMSHIELKLHIKAVNAFEEPLVGFVIKNAAGQAIMGTNTRLENLKLDDWKKGETSEVIFRFENVLTDGNYTVDAAIENRNGTTVSDWWEEAASIKVLREHALPFVVSPPIKAQIIKS